MNSAAYHARYDIGMKPRTPNDMAGKNPKDQKSFRRALRGDPDIRWHNKNDKRFADTPAKLADMERVYRTWQLRLNRDKA